MRRVILAFVAFALTGCPATWGFRGRVYAAKDPTADVHVLQVVPGGTNLLESPELSAIPGARVTCDGCSQPVTLDVHGGFAVGLGTSYAPPGPLVLHVTAPGDTPVDVEVPHPSAGSQAGFPSITIVMTKEAGR